MKKNHTLEFKNHFHLKTSYVLVFDLTLKEAPLIGLKKAFDVRRVNVANSLYLKAPLSKKRRGKACGLAEGPTKTNLKPEKMWCIWKACYPEYLFLSFWGIFQNLE
jgi:hypothetical protein